VFQNRQLTERALRLLRDDGFRVYLPEDLPTNDAAIGFGQIIEASREAFDDLQQLERLEVVRRWLAARSTFTEELAIKVLEELKRRAHLATVAAHPR
jgi:acetolactate synthase regulatory subunit